WSVWQGGAQSLHVRRTHQRGDVPGNVQSPPAARDFCNRFDETSGGSSRKDCPSLLRNLSSSGSKFPDKFPFLSFCFFSIFRFSFVEFRFCQKIIVSSLSIAPRDMSVSASSSRLRASRNRIVRSSRSSSKSVAPSRS